MATSRILNEEQQIKVLKAAAKLAAESELRDLISSIPPCVTIHEVPEISTLAVPPGSIGLFLTRGSTPLVEQFFAALETKNWSQAHAVSEQLAEELKKPAEMSADEVADQLARHTLGELRFAGKSFGTNFGLPEGRTFGLVLYPFNGADIDDKQFRWVESLKSKNDRLHARLVKHVPILTEAEQAALKLVPHDLRDVNIGDAVEQPMTTPTVALLILAAVIMHTPFLGMSRDVISGAKPLTPAEIEKLGPIPTAKELLAVRRNLLKQ